ncbi:MAG TPA: hypothetical protein VGO48_16320 [Conexibacter sp.]|jgi:hypothetical protein|nr:hypothetical protein [Conexibacter sp.]
MSRSRRVLTVLACAASACALSAPAALAGPSVPSNGQGVVLSLAGHSVRLVDKSHRVGDVRVASTRGLHRGDVVSVRNGRAYVSGRVRKLSFLGRVVRSSGHGALVRLGDGSSFKVGGGKPHGHRARSAGNVTIDFQGLAPGQTLLVTIATDAQGNVAITIRVLSSPTDIGDGELHASGVVTDDEGEGVFAIRTDDGSGLRFGDPQQLFEAADAAWCDVVDVSFHKNGGRLIADELRVTDQSDEGDCAEEEWADEVDGTVTALAADGSSLTVAPDDGTAATMIPVDDASLLDGIEVGDGVAVTLDEDGTAIDVELLDWSEEPGDEGGDE